MTDIKNILAKLDEQRKAYTEFRDKQQAEMLEAAKGLFTSVFENFDYVEAIVWTQYTPIFNDGEPCEFSVYDFYAMSHGYLEDDEMYGQYPEEVEYVIPVKEPYNYAKWKRGETVPDYSIEDNEKWDKLLVSPGKESLDALSKVLEGLSKIPDEVYESFGEGLVVVSAEGIDVQEYDHY